MCTALNGRRTALLDGQRRGDVPPPEGAGDDELKFPWTTPFYPMIDMQLGGSWVGSVGVSTLPTAMHVDWVKFYSGSRGGKKFSEFVRASSGASSRK